MALVLTATADDIFVQALRFEYPAFQKKTSLDSPEVRALTSRYGDPKELLAEDWLPGIPGIDAKGRYDDSRKIRGKR